MIAVSITYLLRSKFDFRNEGVPFLDDFRTFLLE